MAIDDSSIIPHFIRALWLGLCNFPQPNFLAIRFDFDWPVFCNSCQYQVWNSAKDDAFSESKFRKRQKGKLYSMFFMAHWLWFQAVNFYFCEGCFFLFFWFYSAWKAHGNFAYHQILQRIGFDWEGTRETSCWAALWNYTISL